MRRSAIAIGLAVLALVAHFAWRRSTPESASAPGGDEGSAGTDRADPVVAGLAGRAATSPSPAAAATPAGAASLAAKPAPVTVTVLDPAGKPVRGARVTLSWRRTPDGAPVSGIGWRDRFTVRESSSGATRADGTVALVPPGPGFEVAWTVEAPLDRDDVASPQSGPYTGGPLKLRANVGGVLEGVVRDQHGQSLEEGFVVWRTDEGDWSRAKIAYDGTFSLPRLAPGSVTIAAYPLELEPDAAVRRTGRSADPPVLPEGTPTRTVDVGAKGVVLVVDMGETLEVRFEGWPPDPGTAHLTREGRKGGITTNVSADGIARFRCVVRDVPYTLWVEPIQDGRTALRAGLRLADSPVTVSLEEGKELRVKPVLPGGGFSWVRRVWIDERGVRARAGVVETEEGPPTEYVFAGLPAGEWTVEALGYRGEEEDAEHALRGRARAAAGGEVVVRLEPAPRSDR
jgi:hypothetical protein